MNTRVLYVDLLERKSWVRDRSDLFEKMLGGVGVASHLLLEECTPKVDPFSPEAPIIFATGPLTGIYPCMAKAVCLFKSPLTGNLGETHAGGHFATALTTAGYGALVIKGGSLHPVVLKIRDDKVEVKTASSLWGLGTRAVDEALAEPIKNGLQSIASIGPAGEHMVLYANVIVDVHHHFGRLGLGAVWGAKKLKAITIIGTKSVPLPNPQAVKAFYEKVEHEVVATDKMSKYHNLGTPSNVLELNALGALPTRNFRERRFEGAEEMSGERFAETVFRRKVTCTNCPVACIHLGSLLKTFAPDHEKGRTEIVKEENLVAYNYEPMFALGSNLGISSPSRILELIDLCEDLGLDAMMTGSVLAWVTEAYERGVLDEKTLEVKPRWGDPDNVYPQMIKNIAEAKTPFYSRLAQGVAKVSDRYGGRDFAASLGGNSPAGYATGYGHIVGTLVGARHSHLSNSGYSIDQQIAAGKAKVEDIAGFLVKQENWLYVLYSLVACYFSRSVYTPDIVVEALATLGMKVNKEDLERLGREIFHTLYRFKIREGFDLEKEYIPKLLRELDTPIGRLDPQTLKKIIAQYIELREREGLTIRKKEESLAEFRLPQSEG
ncbi:MAG: aldehyde ferredoxin oxidoreductase family protein [Thaumarchaeota archaeon]|nr:aldehyde ferredoxin oxidoreductase family protein [Nitrososphaerota archaeon]